MALHLSVQPDWEMLGLIYVRLRLKGKELNLLESLLDFARSKQQDVDPATFLLDAGNIKGQLFSAIKRGRKRGRARIRHKSDLGTVPFTFIK